MNRRELMQALMGTVPAVALLKKEGSATEVVPVKPKPLTMPAQTIPPCVFEIRQANDGELLFSAPLDPGMIMIPEAGDCVMINVKIEVN